MAATTGAGITGAGFLRGREAARFLSRADFFLGAGFLAAFLAGLDLDALAWAFFNFLSAFFSAFFSLSAAAWRICWAVPASARAFFAILRVRRMSLRVCLSLILACRKV